MTTGRTVLLTGASSGMGQLIARTLAGKGHRVFAGMRNLKTSNAPKASLLASFAAPHSIVPVQLDVTSDASVTDCVGTVMTDAGTIDVLINCAGIMWTGTTEAFSTEQFATTLQTNVIGPFRLYKAVLPSMRAAGEGLLITVTSTCGRIIPPNFGIYAASKFALEALAEAIAYETIGHGIQSVIVQPGAFDTNLIANQVQPEAQDIVAQYGDMGVFDKNLSRAIGAAMKENPAMFDPQIVADAVADIIAMPKGARPLRRPVGRTGEVAALNDHIAQAQGNFLTALGFGHLIQKELAHEHA